MLHRPTLIPSTMRATSKNTRNVQKDQSSKQSELCFNQFVENDDIVVVEPTDPDEDRLKEKLKQQGSICCAELTFTATESTSPVPVSVLAKQPTVAETTSTITPLNNVIQSIPETVPTDSTPTMSYVLKTPCIITGGVRNILIPAINTNSSTDGSAQSSRISTVIISPATMNIIRQLVGSIKPPASTQPTSPLNAEVSRNNVNTDSPAVKSSTITTANTETKTMNGFTVTNDNNTSRNPNSVIHPPASEGEFNEFLCGFKKPKRKSPRRNSQIATRAKRFKCTMSNCCLAFRSQFSLTEHIRTHTGECPFTCTIPGCQSAFNRLRTLQHHIKLHSACQRRIDAMKDTQSSDASTVCADDRIQLESHSSSGSIDNGDVKGTTDQSTTALHCSNKTVPHSVPSQCNDSESTTDVDSQKIVTEDVTELGTFGCYRCTYANCDKVYTYMNQLREHLRIHTGERPYMCLEPGCGALFARLCDAHRHANIHVGNRGCVIRPNPTVDGIDVEKPQDQNISNSPSTVPSTSVTSSGSVASIVPNIEQLICRGSTEQSVHEELLRSLQAERRKPPSTCSIAPRYLPTLLSPRTPRPFVCPLKQCGKSFTKRCHFRDHIWGHTGKRPFVCTICSGSFVRVYDLRRHEKIHFRPSGEKNQSRDSSQQHRETTVS